MNPALSRTIAIGSVVAVALSLISVSRADGVPNEARPQRARTGYVSRGGRILFDAKSRPQVVFPNGARRTVGSILRVVGPLHFGEFVWNDRGVPAGPVWIRVDLRAQMMSVFRAGHEIGASLILYGMDGMATPTGVFPVLARLRNHRSSLYDAEMPYTLRLTRDGVAIHASRVRAGAATHGCIGVPEGFAARLFDQVRAGDEVVILNGRAPLGESPGTTAPASARGG